MKQKQVGMSLLERWWVILAVLPVILAMQSVVTSEQQPPAGVLSEGYRDPNIRREHMFSESHGRGISRTRDRDGFYWEFHLSTFIPQEYVVSGKPRLYRAIVFSGGAVTDAAGQTIQLKGKGGLIIRNGKVRTTDRFRIRYRHDFQQDGQPFYSVANAKLTYIGTYNYHFIFDRYEEVQLFLSEQEEIPAYFLTKLDQSLGSPTFEYRGSVIATIIQPDSIDDAPLPSDPIPEPVETVTFTDLVQEATMLKRGDPALVDAEMFILGQQTRVSGQFWDDDKPATFASVSLFRTKIPGLIRVSFLANRQGRLLDASKPRGPSNPNSNPFLAENAFLTELKIVGPLHTLTLTGRYKDDGKGRITIPPTDATLSFMDSLRLFDRLDVFLTFTLDTSQ